MGSSFLIIYCLINSLIIFIISPIYGAEISSKIDLDDEDKITPPTTLSSSVLKAFVDINQGSDQLVPKPSRVNIKQPANHGFTESGIRIVNNEEIDDDEDYISIDDLFKKKKPQIQRRPTGVPSFTPNNQGFYGDTDVNPTIINNIHVTINANSSGPVNGCRNGICDVTVFSKPDAEGNVITNVHLSVVTKMKKPQVQIGDIPVIEGTAGTRRPQFDQLPPFHFVDRDVRYNGGSVFDNNIPQVPIHRQDMDSWYHQTPIVVTRDRPVWHYGRNLDGGFENFENSQVTNNYEILNDKIEPPLSKTKPNVGQF